MGEFVIALSLSFLILVMFVLGFWLGVYWQEKRDA